MGGGKRHLISVIAAGALLAGCAAGDAERPKQEAGKVAAAPLPPDTFVDPQLGFEIKRPAGEAWQFSAGHAAAEGIAVPLVIVHQETGAQVVVQVAPTVASPDEFAARLALGLSTKPGFTTSLPVPTQAGGTSFQFALGDLVFGKVRIQEADGGRTFVLLATWPANAPEQIVADVEQILGSLKPTGAQAVALRRLAR